MKIAPILALLGLVALLAGCVPTAAAPAPYYDSRLGYRFNIPSTWPTGRYGTRELSATELAKLQPLASGAEEFSYLPSDKRNAPQALFTLLVYSQANWEKARTDPGPFNPSVVQPGGLVYAVVFPKASPYEPTSEDGKTYASMVLSLEQIQRAVSTR